MDIARRLFFNLRYYGKPPWDTDISPPELLDFIQAHPPGHALEMGCGTGTNAITLAQHGWQVTGVDYAWRAICLTHKKARRARVELDLRVNDVSRLRGITGPFDLILDIGCFHSLTADSRRGYLDTVERLLAPQGTYLLYVFLKPTTTDVGPGVGEADLEHISARLNLVARKDGTERGKRPSAWLQFSHQGRAGS